MDEFAAIRRATLEAVGQCTDADLLDLIYKLLAEANG